jgi:hypothetical protein
MTDDPADPVNLDSHRGTGAQEATEIRRRLSEVQADQAAVQRRQAELEAFLLAAPATTWLEAAAKARYVIQLLAATLDLQDSQRRKLVACAIEDLDRLAE